MSQHPVSLIYDDQQHYACQNCPARCCRFPWKIALSQAEVDRLSGLEWVRERLEQYQVNFIPADNQQSIMPRVEYRPGDMGCVFLDTDNLCLIQKREGHESIPKTCQVFPISFLTPAESQSSSESQPVFTATNFFCPSISENQGNALQEVALVRFEQPNHLKNQVSLTDTVHLDARHTLSQAAYLDWSAHIERQFQESTQHVPQVLLGLHRTLNQLLTQSSPGTLDKSKLQQVLSEPSTDLPTNPVPRHHIVGRILVTFGLLGITNTDRLKQKTTSLTVKLATTGYLFQLVMETGTFHLWDVPQGIAMKAARKVIIQENSPAFQAEIRRYYRSLFTSKQIWNTSYSLPKAFLLLAANYALILRLTRYITSSQERTEATLHDLQVAIGYSAMLLQGKTRLQTTPAGEMIEQITDQLALFENTFERVLFCESEI